MLRTFVVGILYALPGAMLVLLAISLYRYFSAKAKNKQKPGTYSAEELQKRKLWVVVFLAIVGTMAATVIGLTALLFTAVSFM